MKYRDASPVWNYPDMGCPRATEHLAKLGLLAEGETSHCLDCPFEKCRHDKETPRRLSEDRERRWKSTG